MMVFGQIVLKQIKWDHEKLLLWLAMNDQTNNPIINKTTIETCRKRTQDLLATMGSSESFDNIIGLEKLGR